MTGPPAADDRDDARQDFPAFGAADAANCDREPIGIPRHPAARSPAGARPGNPDHPPGGGDTTRILGDPPAKLLGHPLENWFAAGRVTRLRSLLATEGPLLRRCTPSP